MPSLLWLACSNNPVAGIMASPEPLVLDDQEPVLPRVYAVDGDQAELTAHPVALGPVRGEAVVVEGERLRCVADGVALVTLSAPPLERELEVQCRLVKELRVPARVLTEPGPFDLGAQAIGQDGSPLDMAVNVVSADPEVATPERALRFGRTTLTARAGAKEAAIEVLVGSPIEQSWTLEPGGVGRVGVKPGHYLALIEGEQAARLRFTDSACGAKQGERAELECQVGEEGAVEVLAITADPVEVKLALWYLGQAVQAQ